jgi:RNA-directed DNA polymerase
MAEELRERWSHCGWGLHGERRRLLEFGRYAAARRARLGERRPERFDFLGFTHYCGRARRGGLTVERKTQGQRMRRKLRDLGREARHRRQAPVVVQQRWLGAVLRGH